jgi:N4-gp56 family major capsid protein
MADALTTTGVVTWDQTAYDMLTYPALRPELHFDQVATVKPTRQSMPGAAVVFNQTADLPIVSTAIDESTDVDAVALSDSQVTLTLAEYGNAAKSTAKLRGTSYIGVDPVVLEKVAYNAGISVDTIARDVLKAGTNVLYTGAATARNTVTPSDHFAAASNGGAARVRQAVAQLRAANVKPWKNGFYAGFIHPDVSYDFRGATGGANWRDPHTYSQPDQIWNGEIGAFEGVVFVETSRAPIFADAGSSTTNTDVYGTLICGQEAFAKAWAIADGGRPLPRTFPTPVTDNLRRFIGHGWYFMVAYGIFRQAALRRIESSSSIGAN